MIVPEPDRAAGNMARAAAVFFLVLAVLALIAFGYAGFGRGNSQFGFDMHYLYAAGKLWANHQSPYDPPVFRAAMQTIGHPNSAGFAYPPNAAPLALALGVGTLRQASWLAGLLNGLALCGMIAFTWLAARHTPWSDPARGHIHALVASAIVIGNPFSAHVIWMGQTSLLAAVFIQTSWLLAVRRRDAWAGVFLALAAFKPQLALLFGLWFLLDRRWLLLGVATGTTVLLSAWPVAVNGIGGSWLSWLSAVNDYQVSTYSAVGFRHVFGLESLLAEMGISVPWLGVLAVLSLILLYFGRHRYDTVWLAGVIFAISALLLYAHDYDLAAVSVMAWPLLAASRGRPVLRLVLLMLAVLLIFPQRIWTHLELAELSRTREVALFFLVVAHLVICQKPARVGAEVPSSDVLGPDHA